MKFQGEKRVPSRAIRKLRNKLRHLATELRRVACRLRRLQSSNLGLKVNACKIEAIAEELEQEL